MKLETTIQDCINLPSPIAISSVKWARKPTQERGIICGADSSQEWLLPWWWERYSAENAYPVTFCDFGMSQEAKEWCTKRGEVIAIPFDPTLVTPYEDVDPLLVKQWETCYTSTVWDFRPVWFKKPFALLQSPYKRGVWLDLDCEILQSIEPLFEFCGAQEQLGIMREFTWQHLLKFDPAIVYNSGVIVFEHGAPIIEQWAEGSVTLNHLFWGDEVLLSHLIQQMQLDVFELPGIYNWRLSQGMNLNAVIVHWLGGGGKSFIRQFGGLKPSLREFVGGV